MLHKHLNLCGGYDRRDSERRAEYLLAAQGSSEVPRRRPWMLRRKIEVLLRAVILPGGLAECYPGSDVLNSGIFDTDYCQSFRVFSGHTIREELQEPRGPEGIPMSGQALSALTNVVAGSAETAYQIPLSFYSL